MVLVQLSTLWSAQSCTGDDDNPTPLYSVGKKCVSETFCHFAPPPPPPSKHPGATPVPHNSSTWNLNLFKCKFFLCIAILQVDRSPTGSGVTARVALQVHKGLIDLDQKRTFQNGNTGSTFTGKAVERTKVGDFDAVVVEVSGKAHYVGQSTFFCEDDDEIGKGILVL